MIKCLFPSNCTSKELSTRNKRVEVCMSATKQCGRVPNGAWNMAMGSTGASKCFRPQTASDLQNNPAEWIGEGSGAIIMNICTSQGGAEWSIWEPNQRVPWTRGLQFWHPWGRRQIGPFIQCSGAVNTLRSWKAHGYTDDLSTAVLLTPWAGISRFFTGQKCYSFNCCKAQ